jgi:hypothetical protein
VREGQLAEQLLQHCWRANISVGKAVRRVFIAPNTQCSVGCPALTQGSAWAGFDPSGMSPLGGGGTTPGKRSATIGVGAILDRKRYVGVADGNAVQLASMGALNL